MTRYYSEYSAWGNPYIQIYGNTIYGGTRESGQGNFTGISLQIPATVKNNIVYNSIGSAYILGGTVENPINIDSIKNNLIYNPTNANAGFTGTFTNGTTTITNPTWTQWTSTLGGTGVSGNPLFKNVQLLDLSIQENSPAKDTGFPLGIPYNTDMLGIVRPQGGGYDIGAYEYTDSNFVDITSPQLISAQIVDSITLRLEFSEQMDESSVEELVNYSVSNGINLTNALMTGTQVRLTTSVHTNGTYQVTVNNVTDIAGNVINPQNNSIIYEYQAGTPTNLMKLPVNSVLASNTPEPNHYAEKTLDGKGYYDNDPDSRWAADTMPEWMVYDLGDIQYLNQTRLSFYNWNAGRIYNYSLQVSTDSINWNELRTNVQSDSVEWSIENIEPIEVRYIKTIFIANNQNAWAGLWEAEFYGHLKIPTNYEDDNIAPVQFTLEQNYPNPFNPSTKISWQSPVGSWQTLKVYDILGNEVTTLVNEFIEAGRHEVEFKAENLASGVYIYRIEAGQFTSTKKMILLR